MLTGWQLSKRTVVDFFLAVEPYQDTPLKARAFPATVYSEATQRFMQLSIKTGVPSAPVVGALGWKESCTELLLETPQHCGKCFKSEFYKCRIEQGES
jgi:hypothetical protein